MEDATGLASQERRQVAAKVNGQQRRASQAFDLARFFACGRSIFQGAWLMALIARARSRVGWRSLVPCFGQQTGLLIRQSRLPVGGLAA